MRWIVVENSPNNAGKTPGRGRGRPFEKGNAGRPKGARNSATIAAESLLDGEAEALTRTAIELALKGDILALKICLDRILPPRRERPLRFALPELRSAGDAGAAMAAILAAVASGNTCLGEAAELAKLVDGFVRAAETTAMFERQQNENDLFPALDYGGRRRRS